MTSPAERDCWRGEKESKTGQHLRKKTQIRKETKGVLGI